MVVNSKSHLANCCVLSRQFVSIVLYKKRDHIHIAKRYAESPIMLTQVLALNRRPTRVVANAAKRPGARQRPFTVGPKRAERGTARPATGSERPTGRSPAVSTTSRNT
jgi:hypothetical protein